MNDMVQSHSTTYKVFIVWRLTHDGYIIHDVRKNKLNIPMKDLRVNKENKKTFLEHYMKEIGRQLEGLQ